MNIKSRKFCYGFTLAEAIATLAIAAMIMAAAAGIYSRIRRVEGSINRRLKEGALGREVLQRVAEDVDRLALPGSDVVMTIKNKTEEGGYQSSQMVIQSSIYDKDNKKQVFEKIVWQSKADSDANGMIIYRAHSGYTVEDKMLDEPKEQYEREMFVPVCRGVSLFLIEATAGTDPNFVLGWAKEELPLGVQISISFAEPIENLLGDMEVPEEDIKSRAVAVDRVRQMAYQFVKADIPDINDVNDIDEYDEDGEANSVVEDANSSKADDRDGGGREEK